MNIGAKIRAIRKRKKITITQLSEGTGLSQGFISNVENNKTSPSIATLENIANYLNVPLPYLFLKSDECMRVVRKNERQQTIFGIDQLKIELLTSNSKGLRMMIVESPPGSSSNGGQPHTHEGEECHLILRGKVLATQGEDSVILEEGDTVCWNASVPHSMENIGEETALILIAVYTETEQKMVY